MSTDVNKVLQTKCKNRTVCMVYCKLINYLYDFVVRDIKIGLYLESPRKINFNLVSNSLSK